MNSFNSNRLSESANPYLKQHSGNPIFWQEWNKETFEYAKKINKPIFLSIGYATCHWCHVMAHESFEDDEVAKILNERFVSIKVDREERPDIDQTYMSVCQMISGHGGWPLTIVMSPSQEPFFAATYIPKHSKHGKAGLIETLTQLSFLWENEPDRIQRAANAIKKGYSKLLETKLGDFPSISAADRAASIFSTTFDTVCGGFGRAPKFPSPHNFLFLLRNWRRTNHQLSLTMVVHTLKKMIAGGIFDHVHGGFHRYSTDGQWLLPHFEKMLYDQAMMLHALAESYQATQIPQFKETCEKTISYINERLLAPSGLYYAAEDADSEGEEGKFYTWDAGNLEKILSDEEFRVLREVSNIKPEGNFLDEASKTDSGLNIIHKHKSFSETASALSKDAAEVEQLFRLAIQKLKYASAKRIRPEIDYKCLTDWNALLIGALAKCGMVFGNSGWIAQAENCYFALKTHLYKSGHWLHSYIGGNANVEAFGDDYAFLVWACLELHQATGKEEFVQDAVQWAAEMEAFLWDTENKGFYLSGKADGQALGFHKPVYDGATPSTNSTMFWNYFRLEQLTGNSAYGDKVQELGEFFAPDIDLSPTSHSMALCCLEHIAMAPVELVLINGDDGLITDFIEEFKKLYLPQVALIVIDESNQNTIHQVLPFTKSYAAVENKTTAYFCRNKTCEAPLNTIDAFIIKLNGFSSEESI